jgi:MSHA biogenesis protein MshK
MTSSFIFLFRAFQARCPDPSSFALLIALMGGMSGAWAQVTTDPTRPPSGYGPDEAADVNAGSGQMLQSVLISPTYRAAIINGVVVKLGEKYGDAVLVKVAENEVVLKSGSESQVLKLHPGVEKRTPAPAKSERRRAPGSASPAAPR